MNEKEEFEFHNVTASDDMRFVKHNPTDFDNFKKFQSDLNERFSKLESEKAKKEIKANLKRWEEMLPSRWTGAILTQINPPADLAANKIIELIEEHHKTSLFIKGPSGSGKTYIAYATLRRYIGRGWITPSQIKLISEDMFLGFAASGFEGQNRFNELLHQRFRVYVFDNIGVRGHYSQKEQQLWEQILDHVYSKGLTVIFTSNKNPAAFAAHLSDSAESKLAHLINDKIIEVESNDDGPKLNSNITSNPTQGKSEKDSYDLFTE